MTGQEVWEVWKENPKKVFKRSDCKTTVKLIDNRPHFGNADCFMRIDYFLNNDWQPVGEWREVPFLDAIEAWVDGKKVSYSYLDSEIWYGFGDSNTMLLTIEKIKNAKWYVED